MANLLLYNEKFGVWPTSVWLPFGTEVSDIEGIPIFTDAHLQDWLWYEHPLDFDWRIGY